VIYRQRLTDGPGRVLAARAARSLAVGGRAELSSVVERCYLSLVQSARVHEEHMWQARRMANIHYRRMPPYRRGVQHALPVFSRPYASAADPAAFICLYSIIW